MRSPVDGRSLRFALSLTIVLLVVARTDASSIQDQAFAPTPPDTIPTIADYQWAQTFTVGATGTLTDVDVLVAQQSFLHTEDLQITIFDTSGGAPHVAVTAPVHISPASVPVVAHPTTWSSYAYVRAAFQLPVTTGDVLAIVLSTGPGSQYYWAGRWTGGYPGGQLYSNSGQQWTSAGTEDQVFRTFVAPSRPPTANSGISQTVRIGSTVRLDGSGSYDDNTDTNLLVYSWAFVSVPAGSAVTTLTAANTMTPTFVPDVAGTYVVQLTVTDEDGLTSTPALATISDNPAPTAATGPDQLVVVKQLVVLNGTASDPDGDSIAYSWQFTAMPTGSTAQLSSQNVAVTTFVPDLPGRYVLTLTPSDFVGPGTAATTTITATTAATYAEIQTQAAAEQIGTLSASAVATAGNQNALIHLLSNVVHQLQSGDATGARQQLQLAASRTDGCSLRGVADGNGPDRDWIVSCEAQERVYPLLLSVLAVIAP